MYYYMHMYIYIFTAMHIHMHVHIHIHLNKYTCAHKYVHIHTSVCIVLQVHPCTDRHTSTHSRHNYMSHTLIHTHIFTRSLRNLVRGGLTHATCNACNGRIFPCLGIPTGLRQSVRVCLCVRLSVYACVCERERESMCV